MASRGSLILYQGTRRRVWRGKFTLPDESGRPRQVMRTRGPARTKDQPDGITREEVRAALDDRVSEARRKGVRRREPTTFRPYAEQLRRRDVDLVDGVLRVHQERGSEGADSPAADVQLGNKLF
jgi:hypothetical protein